MKYRFVLAAGLVLCMLCASLSGCSSAVTDEKTPKQILDGTDLRDWIGQKRSLIYEQLLLTDEMVLLRGSEGMGLMEGPDHGTVLLPFVQQPAFEGVVAEAMKEDEWGVELTFAPIRQGEEGRLRGFRLMAAFSGEDASEKAEQLLEKVDHALQKDDSLKAQGPDYLTGNGGILSLRLQEIQPQEWTDIFETLGQMDPSYTHMVSLTCQFPASNMEEVPDMALLPVITEEAMLRTTNPLTWLFEYAGAGYILILLAIGALGLFIRKRKAGK